MANASVRFPQIGTITPESSPNVNIASFDKSSSDRTIAEYAAENWNATPCPME